MANNSKRLKSLDILRGITVAGMLLVNNPGSWSNLYAPLGHAEWIGLTPTDLVFPFFIFCMGVAMFFSLKKFNFTMSKTLAVKMIRRTVLLFIIGWAVQWFSHLMYGMFRDGKSFAEAANNLDSIRYLGVFQRLALVYFFGTLCATFIKYRFIPWVIAGILAVYALILGVGHGYEFSTDNIIAVIDNAVLGPNHMYHESYNGMSVAFDPEGILSTLPCIAHTLIGFMVGGVILKHKDNSYRVGRLLLIGFIFILAGWLLSYGIPCGKKMWSTTFVLLTCGLAMSVLALLIYVIDMKGRIATDHVKAADYYMEASKHGMHRAQAAVNLCYADTLGVTAELKYDDIFLPAMQKSKAFEGDSLTALQTSFNEAVAVASGAGDRSSIKGALYDAYKSITLSDKMASCLYAILFVLFNWIFGYILHKKNIIIKL